MNKLQGTITRIENSPSVSMVEVDVSGDIFCSIVLISSDGAIDFKQGETIHLLFKETEVSLAKNLSGEISLRNRFFATVKTIDRATILSKVILDYKQKEICAIVTTRSADRLNLRPSDKVEWLVKSNEVFLSA